MIYAGSIGSVCLDESKLKDIADLQGELNLMKDKYQKDWLKEIRETYKADFPEKTIIVKKSWEFFNFIGNTQWQWAAMVGNKQ
jgi:hypothetical protein